MEEFDVTHVIVDQHYIDMIIIRPNDGSPNILSTVVNVYLDSAENGAVRIAQMGVLANKLKDYECGKHNHDSMYGYRMDVFMGDFNFAGPPQHAHHRTIPTY